MFNWIKRRKEPKKSNEVLLVALAESATEYVNSHYNAPSIMETASSQDQKEASSLDHSIRYRSRERVAHTNDTGGENQGENDINNIRHSYECPDIRHSYDDSYDSDSIQMAMRSLSSSDSPYKTLLALEKSTNMSFVEKMLEHINRKQLRDSTVYKAAQIDRRLFSKIVSDSTYKPAKDTCIALCLALKLTLSEANDLLSRAGYTFSHSSKRDVILEYFFREGVYNITNVNEVLYRLDQKTLGRM